MFLKNKTMKYPKKGELPFNSGVDKAFYPWLKIQKPLKKKRLPYLPKKESLLPGKNTRNKILPNTYL